MSDEKTQSRFAALAMELYGEKMAIEFIHEVWASASPEAKQRVADRLLEQVAKVDSWHYRTPVEAFVRDVAKELVEANSRALIEERVKAWIAIEVTPAKIDEAAKRTADGIAHAIAEAMKQRIYQR